MINLNIFNQFIPINLFIIPITLTSMVLSLSWIVFSSRSHWLLNSSNSIEIIINLIAHTLAPTHNIPQWFPILISLFFICFSYNILSLIPYSFSQTSHLSITFSLSLPLWISVSTLGLSTNWKNKLSHLVPQGTPPLLIPLMVIIETMSLFIQPLTLGFRLGANLLAGHLLIYLCSCTIWEALRMSILTGTLSFILLITLFLLEIAVSFIQATVFFILSNNYLEENLN